MLTFLKTIFNLLKYLIYTIFAFFRAIFKFWRSISTSVYKITFLSFNLSVIAVLCRPDITSKVSVTIYQKHIAYIIQLIAEYLPTFSALNEVEQLLILLTLVVNFIILFAYLLFPILGMFFLAFFFRVIFKIVMNFSLYVNPDKFTYFKNSWLSLNHYMNSEYLFYIYAQVLDHNFSANDKFTVTFNDIYTMLQNGKNLNYESAYKAIYEILLNSKVRPRVTPPQPTVSNHIEQIALDSIELVWNYKFHILGSLICSYGIYQACIWYWGPGCFAALWNWFMSPPADDLPPFLKTLSSENKEKMLNDAVSIVKGEPATPLALEAVDEATLFNFFPESDNPYDAISDNYLKEYIDYIDKTIGYTPSEDTHKYICRALKILWRLYSEL